MKWCIKPVVELAACKIQNGFAAKRQLIQNTVDLDYYGRREALRSQHAMDDRKLSYGFPGLPIPQGPFKSDSYFDAFDYAMAFPSVSHAWVFDVLNKIMIPSGLFDGI